MTGQEKSDLLMLVIAWTGLTAYREYLILWNEDMSRAIFNI
jgi:hypothetical protein